MSSSLPDVFMNTSKVVRHCLIPGCLTCQCNEWPWDFQAVPKYSGPVLVSLSRSARDWLRYIPSQDYLRAREREKSSRGLHKARRVKDCEASPSPALDFLVRMQQGMVLHKPIYPSRLPLVLIFFCYQAWQFTVELQMGLVLRFLENGCICTTHFPGQEKIQQLCWLTELSPAWHFVGCCRNPFVYGSMQYANSENEQIQKPE